MAEVQAWIFPLVWAQKQSVFLFFFEKVQGSIFYIGLGTEILVVLVVVVSAKMFKNQSNLPFIRPMRDRLARVGCFAGLITKAFEHVLNAIRGACW